MFAGRSISKHPMNAFSIYLAALLIGVIAGLRTFTAPAAVSWAAFLGALQLAGSRLAFLGFKLTPWIFTLLVIAESVIDQLPRTPSRKTPPQFAGRIVSGALCGAAIATHDAAWAIGLVCGIIGAVLGTVGGFDVRTRLARRFGRDRPAGILEDVVAIIGAVAIVALLT